MKPTQQGEPSWIKEFDLLAKERDAYKKKAEIYDECLKYCPRLVDNMSPEEVFALYPDMTEEEQESFKRRYKAGIQHVSEIVRTMGF